MNKNEPNNLNNQPTNNSTQAPQINPNNNIQNTPPTSFPNDTNNQIYKKNSQPMDNKIPSQVENKIQNEINNTQNKTIYNQIAPPISSQKISEEEKNATSNTKDLFRKIFIILVFIGIIITSVATYLLIDDNNKYKTYKATVADLVNYDKIEKNGLIYYKGNYKYKIKRKEYFYTPRELEIKIPNKIIQLKYNEEDPNKIYEPTLSNYFFTMLFTGLGLSFISGILAIAFTTSKIEEIIEVQVIEQVNCVGGKRIYLENISTNKEIQEDEKYYIYFTNNKNKFALGKKLTFNIFKYGEAFTTEKYNGKQARTIYGFNDDDFNSI